MAGKYELLLVPTKNEEKKIVSQPWYKERIKTKFIKAKKFDDPSLTLDGKRWTFVKDGLDDFRDGLPPVQDETVILKGKKGLSPNVIGEDRDLSSVKQSAVKGRFNKFETCYARSLPLQQQRRDHINDIEYGLTQHPLALYPHLEESLAPDLFEDVVDLLDPEMNFAEGTEEDDEFDEHGLTSEAHTSHRTKTDTNTTRSKDKDYRKTHIKDIEKILRRHILPESNKPKNPYHWVPKKEEKKDSARRTSEALAQPEEEEDSHIKVVTKDFCDWVAGLGGETNNIEESTITSLFASGYETKPALSVPIHVVELTNVPQELRMSVNLTPQQEQAKRKQEASERPEQRAEWNSTKGYEPSWARYRYGAWYLPSKQWRKMKAEEKLEDPKKLKEQEMSEAKKRSAELDYELAPMHGAKAFMDFVDTKQVEKNVRKPELLVTVGIVQEKQEKEEKERLEAEAAKQNRQRAQNSLKSSSAKKTRA